MDKRTIRVFGNRCFLLGLNSENEKVWLVDFKWDCGWYWSGGYLNTLTNEKTPELSKDINAHYHIDGLSKEYNTNLWNAFKQHLHDITLTDKELWEICDWFRVFYTLKETAEVMIHGGHYTQTAWIKKPVSAKQINAMIETEVIPAVRALFTEGKK